MKTRRILAASTAALLAFGATAVIASADHSALIGSSDVDENNVKGAISVDGGSTYVVTALKDYTKGKDSDTDVSGGTKDGYKALLETDVKTSKSLSDTVGDITVGISVANAMKLNGKYEFKLDVKTVDEADEELADVGDDSALKDTGLNKDELKKLGKTKASEIKLFEIGMAKDGKVTSYKNNVTLDITVEGSFKGAKVYHVDDNGNLQLIKSDTSKSLDGKYETTFSTNTFSPFIVTTADLKVTSAPTDESSDAETSDGATSTNPETGIALAIAPVVLAAGAVAVVALKKKH